MGRSLNTGNLTVVLYEDPPDAIPKIHVRSRKYMAWIAENNMPVHMHVEKVYILLFKSLRINSNILGKIYHILDTVH